MTIAVTISAGWSLLALAAAATPATVPHADRQRFAIEQVEADAGTAQHRRPSGRGAGQERPRHQPPRERQNEDDARSNNAPPAQNPPGCVYRKAPLELIV